MHIIFFSQVLTPCFTYLLLGLPGDRSRVDERVPGGGELEAGNDGNVAVAHLAELGKILFMLFGRF